MPVRVALEGPGVKVAFSGTVSGADLLAVANAIAEFERGAGRSLHRLVDLSEMTATGVTFTLTMNLARHRREQRFPNAFRSALVASTPATLGFARLFKLLNTNPQIEVEVFATEAEAESWLAS